MWPSKQSAGFEYNCSLSCHATYFPVAASICIRTFTICVNSLVMRHFNFVSLLTQYFTVMPHIFEIVCVQPRLSSVRCCCYGNLFWRRIGAKDVM